MPKKPHTPAIVDKQAAEKPLKAKGFFGKHFNTIAILVTTFILVPVLFAGYVYAASPAAIRNPKLEHYHFRMQILVDGKAEAFSSEQYQTAYAKDQCSAILSEEPIHFHDNKDQLVHIHWKGMTGGIVMKNYGWNYSGGISNTLGYRLDDLPRPQRVMIHGNVLPAVPKGANFYVYSGDENSYKERSFDDWKNQNLETFFGTKSNFSADMINKSYASWFDKLFPKAYAHGTANDADGDDGDAKTETEQEKRTRINNLIGNVVIFAQEDKPSDQQIKDRFNVLIPLEDSTCGG